ncbi:MAG: hypothetical protein KAH86_01515 [Methanosarcinales archaeon]|nr:hypothetical protein [Methanosarcinales archaeon]
MPIHTTTFHNIYNWLVILIAFIGFFRSIQVWMVWKKMDAPSQHMKQKACTSELFIRKNWNVTFLVGTCLSLGILARLVGGFLEISSSDLIADILGLLALVFVVVLVNQWYALTCE